MSYVDDAFDRLKSNLEISPAETDLASKRHNLVRDHVRKSWTLEDDFLTGSYDRHTKTKKLKDVDIFVVIDPDGPQSDLRDGTGKAAVQQLRNVLSTRWSDLDSDDYVVTINYSGEDVASYEVAPVFPRAAGGFFMPRGAHWMATDPLAHADLVTEKNKECDEKFVPFIKMIKGINREAGEPIQPSFLLEVMALELVFGKFQRYRDEIRYYFASAAERITEDWKDPAGIGPAVNETVPSWRRTQLVDTFKDWQATAEEALRLEHDGKERAAVDKWRELFGWRMPRP